MAGNKVVICGVNTSKLPLLSEDEKRALFARMNAGDKSAREEFIRGNLRLVLSVIQRFSGNNIESSDDLFQVGCIGLIKAIDNFDLSHNVRFSTYAVPMIIGEIRRFLRDNSSIRVSRSLRDTAYHAMQVRSRLVDEKGVEPSLNEIAAELGVPESDVVFALDAISDPISLNEPIFRDDGDAVYIVDQVKDDTADDNRWLDGIAISTGMSKLSERERKILQLRFFNGKTQTEVAKSGGISQAQVSRLEKAALARMRKFV